MFCIFLTTYKRKIVNTLDCPKNDKNYVHIFKVFKLNRLDTRIMFNN